MTGGLRCGRFAYEKAIRSGDTGLSSTAIFTGVMMATWADGDGRNVRPAMETLAAAMGKKSEKTARAAVKELAEGQWLEEVRRMHRRPVEYRLTVPSKFAKFAMTNKSSTVPAQPTATFAAVEPPMPVPALAAASAPNSAAEKQWAELAKSVPPPQVPAPAAAAPVLQHPPPLPLPVPGEPFPMEAVWRR